MARTSSSDITGLQKAAVLLISIPERSANIFKHLKEEEIEQLTLEIANTVASLQQPRIWFWMSFMKSAWHSNISQKAALLMQRNFWRRHCNRKSKDVIGKLTASLQVRPSEFVRKQMLHNY